MLVLKHAGRIYFSLTKLKTNIMSCLYCICYCKPIIIINMLYFSYSKPFLFMTEEIRWNIKYEIYQLHSFWIPMILKNPHSLLFARYSSYSFILAVNTTPCWPSKQAVCQSSSLSRSAAPFSFPTLQKYTVFK